MAKNFILDTNVLLHDPQAILSFGDNDVIIPIYVIEEIDRFKRDLSELGRNARVVGRYIDEYRASGKLSQGVKLPTGGRLRVLFTKRSLPEEFGLNQKMDHKILAVAFDIKEREPVRTRYGGYELVTAPPPSSGGIVIAEMLNILEPFQLTELGNVQRAHLVVEAMRRAYRDRALYLGDPDFYDVPQARLTDHNYAAGLRASIMLDRATPSSMLPGIANTPEGTDTTHFSIMDKEGNMIAGTLSVNIPFGSGFMVPGTGFVLNNEMDDFSAKPGEPNAYGLIGFTANEIQPFKRPLSSMSPTLMLGEDKVAVLGTPGGSRIITMVLLGILDFMDGNGPESWVALPRYHHQYLPDKVFAEKDAFTPEEVAALEAMGHTVEVRERRWGNMHGVMWDRKTGEVTAGSDSRSDAGLATVK